MLSERITRRATIIGAAVGGLTGCAATSRSPFFSTLANFRRSSTPTIDPKKVEALPYASMQAWFKGRSRALLVLGEYQPVDRLVWYSADRQSVTTWGPFVLRLLGLDVSVRETSLSAGWSRDLRQLPGRSLEKSVSFQAQGRMVTMQARSEFRFGPMESVDLLAGTRMLRRVEEAVLADGAHRFENNYWLDEQTGLCWQSRQLVIPTMPPFTTQIAKQPQRV